MKKPKKPKLKIKYILSDSSEEERQGKIDKAFGILFDEVFKETTS